MWLGLVALGGLTVASANIPTTIPTSSRSIKPKAPLTSSSPVPAGLGSSTASPTPTIPVGLPTPTTAPTPEGGGASIPPGTCDTCQQGPPQELGGPAAPSTEDCTSGCGNVEVPAQSGSKASNQKENSGGSRGSGRASGHGSSPAAGESAGNAGIQSSVATLATRAAQLAGPFAIPVALAAVAIAALLFMMRGPGHITKLDEDGEWSRGPSSYRL